MDIIQFFMAYVLLFGLVMVVIVFSHVFPFLATSLECLKHTTKKLAMAAVPGVLCKMVNRTIYIMFYNRNPLIQTLSIVLILSGNVVFTLDVLPILYTFEPDVHHIFPPFLLLVSSLVSFYLSCALDPGRISTNQQADLLTSVYEADGVMYIDGNWCETCNQIKPARSKHCGLCGYCVHRFDHHCLWTNNCVGGGNLRYFLLFLIFLELMVAHGVAKGLEAMAMVARHTGMTGRENPQASLVTVYVLIENVFLQLPRCTLLVTSLILLFVLIGLLILYHVMLVLNNQTTNERYKIASLSRQTPVKRGENHSKRQHVNRGLCQRRTHVSSKTLPTQSSQHMAKATNTMNFHQTNNNISSGQADKKSVDHLDNFYNRGILLNLKEVIFPWSEYHTAKLTSKQ